MATAEDLIATGTIATAVIAFAAMLVSSYLQFRALKEAYSSHVQALATVQRRQAYTDLLNSMFSVGLGTISEAGMMFASAEVDAIVSRPSANSDGEKEGLRRDCAKVLAKLTLLEVGMGAEPSQAAFTPQEVESLGSNPAEFLNRVRYASNLAVRSRNRALVMDFFRCRTMARLAGAPSSLMSDVESEITALAPANSNLSFDIDSEEAKTYQNKLVETVSAFERRFTRDLRQLVLH